MNSPQVLFRIFVFSVLFSVILFPNQSALAQLTMVQGNSTGATADADKEKDATIPLETVASLDLIPHGIGVSKDGRVFVCFARPSEKTPFTLAELKNGVPVAYPNLEVNTLDLQNPSRYLISVLSATVDTNGRLWVLDTGRYNLQQVPDAIKLWCIDLDTNKVIKQLPISTKIAKGNVLRDFEIDMNYGSEGTAFLCGTSPQGVSAIITLDLATGAAMRRLENHFSTKAEPEFVVFAEGEMLRLRSAPDKEPVDFTPGLAAISLSADGKTVYYCGYGSNRIFSVDAQLLADPKSSEKDVEKSVNTVATTITTPSGIAADAQGHIFYTDVEDNSIWARQNNAADKKLCRDDRLIWPEHLFIAQDGYMYVSASQFNRRAQFHYGKDLTQKPFYVFRLKMSQIE
jgi:sugar lactone lactonase YvrE